ncbi:MAG: hypothetical protein DI535_17465 [Citrobacter freundii]|nr:MAG: hypothetical protein DI535_17465 [Citrobacter freundii]
MNTSFFFGEVGRYEENGNDLLSRRTADGRPQTADGSINHLAFLDIYDRLKTDQLNIRNRKRELPKAVIPTEYFLFT